MIAAAGPTALWYAARSTGYVSLLLLTAIVVIGVLTTVRWAAPRWPRFAVQAVHRNLSLLALVFLAIHIVTAIVDPFAGISVLNTVAPFTGSYRPIWLGLGVLSMELLVALVITSVLRQRIPYGLWRVVHWAAYACWPLAMLHTLGTGSDVRSAWAVIVSVLCVGAIVLAVVWRFVSRFPRLPLPARGAALLLTAMATIALAGFAVAGPLHSGWARAAGTPTRLLATTQSAAATPAPAAAALPAGLADALTGTVAQSGDTVTVTLTDTNDSSLRVIVSVAGNAATGQLTVTRSGATICATTATVQQDVTATCGSVAVDVAVTEQTDGSISGRLTTRAAR